MDGRAEQSPPAETPASADAALTLGDYTLGARLARRAAADVYDARHTPTGAPRLVYVLRPAAMADHPLVHRVVCEVDAARWLRHPAVAKVDGYGDTPSRRLYVGVERAPGRTLGELLAEGQRLVPSRVVRLAARLVEALDEAHAVGLTHGRLTPDAVLVADDADASGSPQVTLVGLGVGAVAFDAQPTDAERAYVSPEQLAGSDADARSDVFGLASLLQHALLGAVPSVVSSVARVDADAADDEHRSTGAVFAAARSADPRRRPASVKTFWVELLAALVADASAVVGARIERTQPAADEAPVALTAALPAAATGTLPGGLDMFAHLHLDVLDFDVTPSSAPTSADARPAVVAPVAAEPWAPAPPAAPPAAVAAPSERAVTPRRAAHDWIDHDWERERERERSVRALPGLMAASIPSATVPAATARPSGRRRAVALLCLVVPAVAAALGLPLAYESEDDGGARFQEAAAEVTTPYELPVEAPRAAAPAEPRDRDSVETVLPALPAIVLPDAGIPAVDPAQRTVVRPGDFAKGLTRPDSLR